MSCVKKNYLYSLAYQILAIIIPIITTPYVSRVLGATALGEYSYTYGIVTYFGIFVLTGTQSYGQREISARAEESYQKSVKFYEILFFRIICLLLVLPLYLGFIVLFGGQYKTLYTIQLLTLISWILDISWYYQGVENFRYTVIRNCIIKLVATCLVFIIVKDQGDLYKYTLIMVSSVFIGNGTFWMRIRKEIVSVKLKDINIFSNFKGIMQLFIPVVAVQIYTVLDQTMIGILVNTTEVGYYSQGEKIIKLSLTVISSLSVVLLPRISNLFANKQEHEIQNLYEKSLSFIFILADPMIVGCIVISPLFVPVFYGNGYNPVVGILRVLSVLFIVLSVGQLYGSFLVAIKKQNLYTKAVVSAAIVNFILNFIMMYFLRMGAIGASIATIIAETISTVIQACGAKDLFEVKTIFKYCAKYILPSGIMGLVTFLIMKITPINVIGLISTLVVAGITYIVVLLIIRDETCIEILSIIKRKSDL